MPRLRNTSPTVILFALLAIGCNSSSITDPPIQEGSAARGCTGLEYTLVPNEFVFTYGFTYWQPNQGTLVAAFDEIAEDEFDLDTQFIFEWIDQSNRWARFKFSDIASPHQGAVISDITATMFIDGPQNALVYFELLVNGSVVANDQFLLADEGMNGLSKNFQNFGYLPAANTLEIRFRSANNVDVHAVNALVRAFVPGKNCPDLHGS